MALNESDLGRLAQLSRLAPDATSRLQQLSQLNHLLEQLQPLLAVDTTGVAPLLHPSECLQADMQLYLAADTVTATNQRSAYLQNAPAADQGLFLVPKVIE